MYSFCRKTSLDVSLSLPFKTFLIHSIHRWCALKFYFMTYSFLPHVHIVYTKPCVFIVSDTSVHKHSKQTKWVTFLFWWVTFTFSTYIHTRTRRTYVRFCLQWNWNIKFSWILSAKRLTFFFFLSHIYLFSCDEEKAHLFRIKKKRK